jgi:signal transduction histidine kinase
VTIGRSHGSSFHTTSLFIDSSNSLWAGSESAGIYRIRGNTVEHFDTSDGLSGDDVLDLFEDEEHNLWVATSAGIDCFRDLPVVSYTKREGLTADEPNSVYAAEDGTVWVGIVDGLDSIRNGVVSPVRTGSTLPGSEVTAMLVDRMGHLWLGIDDELYLYELGHFSPILDTKGKRSGKVTELAQDVDGSIWAVEQDATAHQVLHIRGYVIAEQFAKKGIRGVVADPHGGIWLHLDDGIAHRQKDGVEKFIKVPPGIHIENSADIVLDQQGALWSSIGQDGILRSDGDKTQILGTKNGLPCASHGSLIFDNQGSLWLTLRCGIARIDRNSLQNWIQHPESKVSTFLLDRFDGVQLGYTDFHPSASRGRDGRLWFVNGWMVQMLDPAHLHINSLPPPIHIEQLIADHENVAITPAIHLAPLTRDIQIDYTALSFVMPRRVRFRYKLEGHDKEWQDCGTRRSAFYTNLRPGKYKFLVTASNNSGVWNSQGDALSLEILPAWYQTTWFRLLALLFLALLSYAFYLVRMRQYAAAMKARFNERLDERIRIARELHDTLLQSFHGLMFQFQAARNLLPRRPESAMQTLDEAIFATEQAIEEGRNAIHDLRPESPAQLDIAELLTTAGQEMARVQAVNGNIPSFRVIVEGKPQTLSPTLEDEIYRIGREVIRNAFHHAAAGRIEVEIRYDEDQLRLRIRDDGKGIDPKVLEASGRPGHWGLPGIRERAQRIGSQLEFWSEAGAGTEVELRIPAAIAYERQRDGSRYRLFRRGGSNSGRS